MRTGILVQINSNILFYGGITLMGIAIIGGIISGIVIFLKGRMLKKELELDYGELGKAPDTRRK